MKHTAKQRRLIRFQTFETDRNQGSVLDLGDAEVFVDRVMTTVTSHDGCTSRELKTEIIDTVTMEERTFIPSETMFWRDGDPKETITLPHGFVPSFLKPPVPRCQCCRQPL